MRYIRKDFVFGYFVMLLFFALSCKQSPEKQSKPVITVSILPQKYLVEQIAGDLFEIEVLIPPGASPVTYEPLPKQLLQIKESSVYFQIGELVFEHVWTNKVKSINPDLEIIDLSKNISLIEGDHNHGDEHHEHVNPHIWMSPQLMKKMGNTVTEILEKIQPEHAELFKNNNAIFQAKMDSLHLDLQNAFSESENKSFLIYHPALTYFAKDYGLNQISFEKEGKEPSPKAFTEIIEIAKKENIKKILVQSQFDKSNATVLAKEINAEVVSINPLTENWEQEIVHLKNVLTQK